MGKQPEVIGNLGEVAGVWKRVRVAHYFPARAAGHRMQTKERRWQRSTRSIRFDFSGG
jgi:hypothetical protein